MRFLSAVLFLALTGSVALADDAKPADAQPEATVKVPKQKVPLRVVRMLPETGQVLLFDKTKGTHVVAEVGQDVDGYRVDDIDDDEVTLIAPSGSEVILTAPWHRKADRKTDAKKAAPAPQDPYADASTDAAPGPADPYADASPGPVVSPTASATSTATGPTATTAPIVAGDSGARVVSASGAAATADGTPSDPYGDPAVNAFFDAVNSSSTPATKPAPTTSKTTKPAKASVTTSSADGAALGAALTGSPAPASTPGATSSASTSTPGATPSGASPSPSASAPSSGPTASAPSPGPTTATLKRAEIDAALGDFAGTAATFQAAFTAQGLRFDDVAAGSLLAKVGLQKGDVLTTVDGQPLRSLDDAANLYARLPTAHGSTLQVQRAGKPVTLRIAIQ